MEERVSTRKRY